VREPHSGPSTATMNVVLQLLKPCQGRTDPEVPWDSMVRSGRCSSVFQLCRGGRGPACGYQAVQAVTPRSHLLVSPERVELVGRRPSHGHDCAASKRTIGVSHELHAMLRMWWRQAGAHM
jgi:hypothetical protein